MPSLASYATAAALCAAAALAQEKQSSTPGELSQTFAAVNRQILEMAQDFPEDKYSFRLRPEMRSFGEVIVHIMSGNVYAAKAGRGEKANWDELNAKNYPTKAQIVAAFQKSIADSTAVLKASPEAYKKSIDPWLSVIEHSAEHYGLLVAYYRANGIVPPASRPKK